ncbi:hypothetical protein GGF50DRAFT_111916 [Schizophyllum commune]
MQALSSFVVYRKLFFSKGKSARVTAEPEPQPPSATSSFSAHGSLPTPLPSPPEIVFDITPDDHGQSPSIRERVKGPIPWRHDAHTSLDGSNEDDSSIAYLRDNGSILSPSDDLHDGRPRLAVDIPPEPVISVPQEPSTPPPRPPRKRPIIPPIQIPNLVPTKPLDLREKTTPKPTQTSFKPKNDEEQRKWEDEVRQYLDGQSLLGVNADVRLSFSPIAEEESGAEEEENEIMDLGNLPPKKQEAESDAVSGKASRRQSRSRKTASRTVSLRSLHVRPKSIVLEDGTVRTFSSEDAHMARLIMSSVLDGSQLSPSIYSFGASEMSPDSAYSAVSTNSKPFWAQDDPAAPPVPPMPPWYTPTDGRTPDSQLERNLDEAAPRTSTSTETGVKPPALPTPPEALQIRVDDTDPTYASGSLSAVTASSDGRARILNEFPKVPPLFMGGKYLSSMDSPMTAKPESATLPMPPAAPWSQNRLAPATPTRTAVNNLPFGPSHSRTKSGTVVPLPRPPTQKTAPPDFAVTAVPLDVGEESRTPPPPPLPNKPDELQRQRSERGIRLPPTPPQTDRSSSGSSTSSTSPHSGARDIEAPHLSTPPHTAPVGTSFYTGDTSSEAPSSLHDISEEDEDGSSVGHRRDTSSGSAEIKALQHRLSLSDKLGGPRPRGPGGPRLPAATSSLRGKRMGPREPLSRRSSASSLVSVSGRLRQGSNAERPPLPPLPGDSSFETVSSDSGSDRRPSLDSTHSSNDTDSVRARSVRLSIPIVEEEEEKQTEDDSVTAQILRSEATPPEAGPSSPPKEPAKDVPEDAVDQEVQIANSYIGKASDGSTPILQQLMSELMDEEIEDLEHADDEATDARPLGLGSRKPSLRKRHQRPVIVHGKSNRNAVIRTGVQRQHSHRRDALARSRSAALRRHGSVAPEHDPKFEASGVAWRAYTYDDVQSTLTSAELQAIVSHAIRASGSTENIRILPLDAVDEVADEQARLEERRRDIKGQYTLLARERGRLFDDRNRMREEAETVLEEIRGVSLALDALAEELHSVDEQISQLSTLRSAHSASALSLALRKLHSSLSRQQAENLRLKREMKGKQSTL